MPMFNRKQHTQARDCNCSGNSLKLKSVNTLFFDFPQTSRYSRKPHASLEAFKPSNYKPIPCCSNSKAEETQKPISKPASGVARNEPSSEVLGNLTTLRGELLYRQPGQIIGQKLASLTSALSDPGFGFLSDQSLGCPYG